MKEETNSKKLSIELLYKQMEEMRKELINQDMYIDKLKLEYDKEIERLNNIIKEVREYIENNDLYEQDYDYDYEENLVVGPPSDETARKILLEILDKEVN